MTDPSSSDDAAGNPAAGRRPAAPTTVAELERSIRVIRIAISFSVIAIVAMTVVFVAALDAPAVPLVPLAALVVIVDFVMLVGFTRQRRRAIEQIAGRPSDIAGG